MSGAISLGAWEKVEMFLSIVNSYSIIYRIKLAQWHILSMAPVLPPARAEDIVNNMCAQLQWIRPVADA